MSKRQDPGQKRYYFVDIDTHSRQILSWDTETRDNVDVKIENGCYRIFLSKGQYNKLVKELEAARR